MTVSIIICTRNRAESLFFTLQSVGEVHIPPGWSVELLVVDNGSSDRTRAVVEEAGLSNVTLRYINEPTPGQCRARNAGLHATSGDIVLFTDDDVRVPKNWIEGMCRPILEKQADAVQGGIRVAPHLDRPWLVGALRVWVAGVEDPHRAPEGLVGANMAFAREALKITGGFDTRLGPGAAGFFDDTVFGWSLKRAGKKIIYLPQLAVEHHFSPDRLKLGSFVNTAKRMASSRALVVTLMEPSPKKPSVLSGIAELPRLAVRSVTQTVRLLISGNPDEAFLVCYYRTCLWFALRKKLS